MRNREKTVEIRTWMAANGLKFNFFLNLRFFEFEFLGSDRRVKKTQFQEKFVTLSLSLLFIH